MNVYAFIIVAGEALYFIIVAGEALALLLWPVRLFACIVTGFGLLLFEMKKEFINFGKHLEK